MLIMPVSRYKLTKRGIVRVKGKGDVNTYWLNEQLEDPVPSHHIDHIKELNPLPLNTTDNQLLSTNVN